jgi:ATP-dependent Clp protease adaptor protein ClpS
MSNTNPNRPDQAKAAQPRSETLAQWNVVLFSDAEHSHNYVTTMLADLFKVRGESCTQLAASIARTGRGVVMTTHKEYAEFKRDQILSFGKDALVERCTGSMAAVIEPAAA